MGKERSVTIDINDIFDLKNIKNILADAITQIEGDKINLRKSVFYRIINFKVINLFILELTKNLSGIF